MRHRIEKASASGSDDAHAHFVMHVQRFPNPHVSHAATSVLLCSAHSISFFRFLTGGQRVSRKSRGSMLGRAFAQTEFIHVLDSVYLRNARGHFDGEAHNKATGFVHPSFEYFHKSAENNVYSKKIPSFILCDWRKLVETCQGTRVSLGSRPLELLETYCSKVKSQRVSHSYFIFLYRATFARSFD
jgi:hypothetical protein